MLIEELHKHYGTWAQMMRSLEMGSCSYQNWQRNGYIPYKAQIYIEKITKGRFIASKDHAETKYRNPIDY